MEWIKVIIEAPGFLGGAAVRQHLTGVSGLPGAFFHHDDSGQSLQGPAPVRMFGNGHRVSVLGIGDEGRDLILAHVKGVLDAFRGSPVRIATGTFKIYPTREDVLWDIHSCVLKLPVQYTAILASGNYRAADRIVAQFIGRSLRRQVAWLCPEMRQAVATVPIEAAVYRSVAVETQKGYVLPAVNCLAKMPLRLVGPWQFGTLQARGYGRCRPARKPEEMDGA